MNLKNCETTVTDQNSKTGDNFRKAVAGGRNARRKRSSTIEEVLLRVGMLALVLLSITAVSVLACGPFFPNNLLDRGDEALLSAPIADFGRELARLNLAPSRFAAVPATNSYEAQTFDAEMADLAAALKDAKVSPEDSARIVEGHRVNRKKLSEYLESCHKWTSDAWMDTDENTPGKRGPQPAFPLFGEVPGLPGEFADYFAGAVALRKPKKEEAEARQAWEQLLARPAAERKYKSTWAAYMLGTLWEKEDPDKAVGYCQKTRDFAKRGLADSIGLATAAFGLEARVELRRGHFKRALELYLQQYAAGDGSALLSLRSAAREAVTTGGEELAVIAAAPNERAVVTAFLICGEHDGERFATSGSVAPSSTARWLMAVEAAGVKDVDSAERLALAAYQEGEFELAQRWIKRAHNTPVAQWLQAKLYLRAGKVAPAAALFAQLADRLPVVPESEATNSTEFADSLHIPTGRRYAHELDNSAARVRVMAEFGVLQLSRGEFAQALDALLRSAFWQDAAYVAERVLTTDELKTYVDQNWPMEESRTNAAPIDDSSPTLMPHGYWGEIRYLLARRLTRELRSREAREYFPKQLQASFDELVVALNAGWNEGSPAAQRAQALFVAAKIARTNGMELLGTELAPDWHINDGEFDKGLTWQMRATNSLAAVASVASEEEIQRASRPQADPEERFHYRYQAAFLAWEAAKLMPDNADETARVLCTAGTWLKDREPETADLFYKSLVRRCRQTAIGAQADRMRWFPILDAAGNPKPYQPRRKETAPATSVEESMEPSLDTLREADNGETPPATRPVPGRFYTVHFGDSISAIANAVSRLGQPLTPKEILEANPDLDPARLKVGQKILIPTLDQESETDEAKGGPANDR